jgi:hypothetical protein
MAGGRVHDQTRRLVDDDQVGILVEDLEREVLRNEVADDGLGRLRVDALDGA